jgi:hypothetical protein
MLARTVVVKRRRASAEARERLRRRLMQRPMRAAHQRALIETGAREHAGDAGDMIGFSAVGRAGQGKLFVTQAEALGPAGFDQNERLQGLDRGAWVDGSFDIAEREQASAICVNDRNSAAMPAFNKRAAQRLDQNRTIH